MRPRVSRVALTDQVYDQILASIFDQSYLPGQQLNVNQLATELGVSSTPVREALSRLTSERIVEQASFKGFRVAREMDHSDIEHLFDARILLETYVARHAIDQDDPYIQKLETNLNETERLLKQDNSIETQKFNALDREFHRLLVEANGNPYITISYDSLESHIHIGRLYLRNRGVIEAQSISNEHTAIFQFYRAGQSEQAAAALRHHLENARQRVLSFLKDRSNTGTK